MVSVSRSTWSVLPLSLYQALTTVPLGRDTSRRVSGSSTPASQYMVS